MPLRGAALVQGPRGPVHRAASAQRAAGGLPGGGGGLLPARGTAGFSHRTPSAAGHRRRAGEKAGGRARAARPAALRPHGWKLARDARTVGSWRQCPRRDAAKGAHWCVGREEKHSRRPARAAARPARAEHAPWRVRNALARVGSRAHASPTARPRPLAAGEEGEEGGIMSVRMARTFDVAANPVWSGTTNQHPVL